jgi:molybdopterin converting factor small subunit
MPRVVFTANLQRHVACPECTVAGATLREALHEVFAGQPQLRDYLLDEQGHLRRHVFIFVDGRGVRDRERLAVPLEESSEIYVMQALTGG